MSLVQFAIAEDPPNRLDKALFRDAPEQADLSRTRLGKLIEQGAVRINGKIADSLKTKVAAGAEIGIDLSDHGSTNLTRALVTEADQIFCLSESHRISIVDIMPEAEAKTLLLDPSGQDVTDPFGGDLETYRLTRSALEDLIGQHIEALVADAAK